MTDKDRGLDQLGMVVDDLGQTEAGELLCVLTELRNVAVPSRPLGRLHRLPLRKQKDPFPGPF